MASTHEYPFITNYDCPHFPCHEGVDPDDFNCLFCYCPLYMLGDACGGNFTRTSKGAKNCTSCSLPHQGDNGTRLVKAHWKEIAARAAVSNTPSASSATPPAVNSENEREHHG